MIRVAINGLGRIGRLTLRAWHEKHKDSVEIVALNTSGSMPASGWAHLIKYDTIYHKFSGKVESKDEKDPREASDNDPKIGSLIIDGKEYPVLAQRDPTKLPWKEYEVDVVLESTGAFTTEDGARKHITAGAKKVVISAPSKGGAVQTVVLGVNEANKDEEIISNASCTTNCVAPVAAVMHASFGIEKAMMTTIHGYTDDQRLQDNSHKDLRRARAAAMNIIPTTTGAAVATTETIPELKGLFDGRAIRVPVATGSITDFSLVLKKPASVDDVNNAFVKASENPLYKGILAVTQEPLVSSDIVGRDESAVVDLSLTQVVGGNLVKVFAWYDNEWGYANRLIEQAKKVGESLNS